jgi:50S ribosomal protein L16 3-hydroxylase
MLYLPPELAHDGIAIDACTTYSIGFRAAAYEELAQHFLDALRDRIALPGRYADPGLRATRSPARIDPAMTRTIAAAMSGIRWQQQDVRRFVGAFLSEPKATVQFSRPARRSAAAFAKAAAAFGLALDRRTQLLYDDAAFYVNGEPLRLPVPGAPTLRVLANARALSAAECRAAPRALRAVLHEWYAHGYLAITARPRPRAGRAA